MAYETWKSLELQGESLRETKTFLVVNSFLRISLFPMCMKMMMDNNNNKMKSNNNV